jgi:signal transduction histidine kinase
MKREDERPGNECGQAVLPAPDERKVFEEITALNNELVTAQRELARRNSELTRLNEEKNHFLGVATHDLRNPLAAIYSSSEFLLSQSDRLDSEQVEILSAIKNSSLFMLQLVEDLLHLSQIESGKIQLRIRDVDLAELVRRHSAVNRPVAARKNIRLDFDIEPNLPAIEADPHKLEQVLENLISNAIKFSPPGTAIVVTLRGEGAGLKLAVADQGPGIPVGEQKKLFLPFSRTSVRPTGREKSSGLGLAIARNIVEAHRGRIGLESEVGKGSTFFVTLPVKAEPAAPS